MYVRNLQFEMVFESRDTIRQFQLEICIRTENITREQFAQGLKTYLFACTYLL